MMSFFRSFIFWGFLVFSIVFLGSFLPLFSVFFKDKEKVYFSATSFFSKLLLLLSWVPIQLRGKEYLEDIPKEKGIIIAANHASFLDYFVLQAKFPLPLRYVVWWSGFRIPFLKTIYKGMGYVGASERGQDLLSSYQLYKALKEGKKLVIFSRPSMSTEESFEFNPAIIKLSLSSGTPILPVAIRNSSKALPLGKFLLNPGQIKIKIGKPLFFESTQDLTKEILRLYLYL